MGRSRRVVALVMATALAAGAGAAWIARAQRPVARAGPPEVPAPTPLTPSTRPSSLDPTDTPDRYWALIIGINDYAGGTPDNVGSYQDATSLRRTLLSIGWRSDHIRMIVNRKATRTGIVRGLVWLASVTNKHSTVIFHYAGHENFFQTPADGDNEPRDVALWASDNQYLLDGDLGRLMGNVRAKRMWIQLAVCRAAGFDDAGMVAPGRVITYSSAQEEFSYEDSLLRHSVVGYYMIEKGMALRAADRNNDGDVSVEEAFAYALPPTLRRTKGYDQHPVIVDKFPGEFVLRPRSIPVRSISRSHGTIEPSPARTLTLTAPG